MLIFLLIIITINDKIVLMEVFMKKGILLSLLIGIIFITTGCAGKNAKLVCTQTTSGVDITFNVDFKGNTVQSIDFGYDMDLSKYTDSQITAIGKQDFCTRVKSSMSQYKDAFLNCDQSIENKHLVVKSALDVDKISNSLLGKKASPKSAKTELEKVGYSCTIQEK